MRCLKSRECNSPFRHLLIEDETTASHNILLVTFFDLLKSTAIDMKQEKKNNHIHDITCMCFLRSEGTFVFVYIIKALKELIH